MALSGTFEQLAIFANLASLSLYFLCAISAWVLRRRDVRTDGEPFRMPGGATVPIAACLAIAWLFYETIERAQLIALVVVLLVILALYALRAWRLRANVA
jgi:amino acid transporter